MWLLQVDPLDAFGRDELIDIDCLHRIERDCVEIVVKERCLETAVRYDCQTSFRIHAVHANPKQRWALRGAVPSMGRLAKYSSDDLVSIGIKATTMAENDPPWLP